MSQGILTVKVVSVAVVVASLSIVITRRSRQSEMMRVSTHRVPLFKEVSCPLNKRVLAESLWVAWIPGNNLLQPLQAVFQRVLRGRCVHKPAGHVATELLALERQRHVAWPWRVAMRQLNFERMRRDKLGPDEHRAEQDLDSFEEVLANHDHSCAAAGRSLGRTQCPDHRRGQQVDAGGALGGVDAAGASAVF